jgi:hypothetical protein
MTTTVAANRARERWFLDRGVPSVLTQRARLRAIWPRSALCLAFGATLAVCSAMTYWLTGRNEYVGAPVEVQRIGLAAALLSIPVVAGIGWFVARLRSDRATWMLFFIMSLVLITPELLTTCTQRIPTHGTLLGYPIPVAQAVFRRPCSLAPLPLCTTAHGLSVTESTDTSSSTRLIDDLKLTLLARNGYLNRRR